MVFSGGPAPPRAPPSSGPPTGRVGVRRGTPSHTRVPRVSGRPSAPPLPARSRVLRGAAPPSVSGAGPSSRRPVAPQGVSEPGGPTACLGGGVVCSGTTAPGLGLTVWRPRQEALAPL